MRLILTASFLALLVAAPLQADDRPATGAVLKVGAVASSAKSVDVFRAMRFHFKKNGMPMEFVLFSNYDALGEALLKGQVDIAWNSPLAHARFHVKAGDSQAVVMRDVDVNYRVTLIARKDANISTVADLAGKSMLFGSCESADCTVLPVHFLRKSGVPFEKVKIVSLHDEVDDKGVPCHSSQHVLAALLKGRGDAGVIGSGMWQKLQETKPDQAAQFKAIWTSPPFSHCVFTARKDFAADTGERFTKLMLAMDGKDPVTAEILKLEHCSKWVLGGKSAQDGFEELFKAVRDDRTLPASLRK